MAGFNCRDTGGKRHATNADVGYIKADAVFTFRQFRGIALREVVLMTRLRIQDELDFETYIKMLQHDAEKKNTEKRRLWVEIGRLKRHGRTDIKYRAW